MTIYIWRAKEGLWNKSRNLAVRSCSTVAALFLPSLAMAVTPTYTLTDLGLLPGTTVAESIHINGKGDSIGVGLNNAGTAGILYHNKKVINVAPTATQSFASDINSASQIAGYMYNGTAWVGFTYQNGVATGFNVPGSTQTFAQSLNDIGQTAGDCSPSDTSLNSADHIFVKQPNGTFSDLGQFGINPSALSINNQGRVLIGTNDGVRDHTLISKPGSTSFEEISSLMPNCSVSPGQMNNLGVVVGTGAMNKADTVEHAYVYYNSHMKDLGSVGGADFTGAWGINNLNQIVGGFTKTSKRLSNGTFTPEVQHGWVDVDGTLRDVNGMLNQSGTGWAISMCHGINDLDQVLADASFNGGATHVVKLTPDIVLPNLAP